MREEVHDGCDAVRACLSIDRFAGGLSMLFPFVLYCFIAEFHTHKKHCLRMGPVGGDVCVQNIQLGQPTPT